MQPSTNKKRMVDREATEEGVKLKIKHSRALEMVNVTLITGDGIGPEIAEATRRCVDATGAGINWEMAEAGMNVMSRLGTPLPDATIESVK